MKKVIMYTDGACFGNPGPGGWGGVLFYNGYQRELYGGESQSTNNRMELKAAIEALNVLRESCEVSLYTDSIYVSKGICEWIEEWKKNGWKTRGKKLIKNNELWKQLDLARTRHQIIWHWIKAHAGIPGNERADALARKGAEKFLRNDIGGVS